jgi:hypothetical protein
MISPIDEFVGCGPVMCSHGAGQRVDCVSAATGYMGGGRVAVNVSNDELSASTAKAESKET